MGEIKKNNQSEASVLRQKAEERLKNKLPKVVTKLSETEKLRLIHELEVHQVELEMQNQELIQAKEQATIASEKYIGLYDNAPAGYFTLSRDGEIIRLNIAGAKMLGNERPNLINKLFQLFISDNSKPLFLQFLDKLFDSCKTESCVLALSIKGNMPTYVYLNGIVPENGIHCLMTAFDITERRLFEARLIENQKIFAETEKTGKIGGWSFNAVTLTQNWTQETFNILEIDTARGEPKVPEGIAFIDEPFRQKAEFAINRAIEFGEPFDQEWKVTTAKGNKRWVNAVGKAKIVNGKTVSISGSFQDITKRKQAEEALLASEKKYHAIFNNIQDVFYQTDLDGTVLEVSPSVKNFSEYERDEIIGKHLGNLFADVKDKNILFDRLEKNGELNDYELRTRTKNGELKYVSINARVIFGHNGGQDHIIGVIRDITERKRTQKLLDKNNKRYQELVNSISDIFFSLDKNLRITFWNKATEKLTGLWSEDVIGLTMMEIFPENAGVQNLTELFQQVTRYKKPRHLTINYLGNGNRAHDVSVYPNEDGISVFARDITDRKRAEESLIKLKTAIEKSEISIVITDSNGCIEYANPFFTKLTGYMANEYIGQTPAVLKSGYHTEEFYREMWSIIKSGRTWEGEFYNRKKNGEMYWENAIISPVMNGGEEITHFVAIKTDVTNAKNINAELLIAKQRAEESDRLKSAFLANMSHEIRTPMNGILGFTELLKEPDLSGEQQKYYIDIIEKSGARLLNIINDIIDISKIESGLMKTSISEINANEYMEQVHAFFNPEAEIKNLKIISKNGLPADEAVLKTDSEKLYAILINLVKNALKYTETGFIEIGYNRAETLHATSLHATSLHTTPLPVHSYLQFYVKDTGIGIPKDRQEAIFERFIQADIVDKMARQGAGLGLAISKAYVEMLGGRIWVESEEGQGSTFYFTLPYIPKTTETTETTETPETPPGIAATGLKILIAEDDEPSVQLISIGVRKFAGEIIIAETGTKAVEACRANPGIDLILMDMQMPGMNGYEATRQIREFNPDVVIIAQTSFALGGDREKALEAGCNDYIPKPIQRDELVLLVHKYFKKTNR